MRRRGGAAVGAAVALAVALIAAGCGGGDVRRASLGQPVSKRSQIPPGTVAQDFSLYDAHHHLISLAHETGNVVLLTFLYTHCVDECPGIAHNLNEVLRDLGHARQDVRVIAVSVDPKFDTVAAVRKFERLYRLLPEFHYLIGPRLRLQRVWRAYNVLVEPRSTDLLRHSAPIYLLDRRGIPRYAYPWNSEPPTILSGVRELLHKA